MTPEPTINFLNALSLFGGVQGIVLALMILYLGKRNKIANRYLAAILSLAGLILLHQFLWETNYIYKVPYLLNSIIPFQIIILPALYLYIYTMTAADNTPPNWFWVVMPVIVMWVVQVPFHLADFNTKLSFANNTYIYNRLPLLLRTTFVVYFIMSILAFTVYIALSFRLLFAHTRNIAHFFSYKENIELAWLRNLLLAMVFFLLYVVIYYLLLPYFGMKTEAEVIEQTNFMYACLEVSLVMAIFYFGVMGLLQTCVYKPSDFAQVEFQTIIAKSGQIESIGIAGNQSNKYKNSALDRDQSEVILKQLLYVMDNQKPYLQSNLTLQNLAVLISVPPHYLSQVINEQLNMNFFDYINGYRIDAAKKLLTAPPAYIKTILDVATAAAFNSRSAFYTAFKKQVDMTPVEYKKTHS